MCAKSQRRALRLPAVNMSTLSSYPKNADGYLNLCLNSKFYCYSLNYTFLKMYNSRVKPCIIVCWTVGQFVYLSVCLCLSV